MDAKLNKVVNCLQTELQKIAEAINRETNQFYGALQVQVRDDELCGEVRMDVAGLPFNDATKEELAVGIDLRQDGLLTCKITYCRGIYLDKFVVRYLPNFVDFGDDERFDDIQGFLKKGYEILVQIGLRPEVHRMYWDCEEEDWSDDLL